MSDFPSRTFTDTIGFESWIPTISTTDADFPVNRFLRSLLADYYWTPNFNGVNSYGELLSAYSPTGAGANLETGFLYKSDGAIQQLLAPDTSTFNITISATDVISWDLLTNVEINGVAATSGVTTVPSGYYVLTGTLDSTADIKVLAANASLANNFQTQLHYLNVNDPLDISNSIEIDTVIRAAEMPTETSLYNKLDTEDYPELVANGDFSDGLDGWNLTSYVPTTSVENGELVMIQTSSSFARQSTLITTVVGGVYSVYAECRNEIGTSSLGFFASNDRNLNGSFSRLYQSNGIITGVFVATSTLTYVGPVSLGSVGNKTIYDNISVKQTNIIGEPYNLGTDQPYVPQLKGGEIDRSQVDGKFEMYLGSYSTGDFDNGVDTVGAQLSVAGTQVGSASFTGFENYIIVLKTGAVLKLTTIPDANTANYSVVLGTDTQIQSGAEYPNVARVLEPDVTAGSEYKYFNDGGSYPFTGA